MLSVRPVIRDGLEEELISDDLFKVPETLSYYYLQLTNDISQSYTLNKSGKRV